MAEQNKNRKFLYIEASNNPLKKVDNSVLKEMVLNPITGKPYNGIILEGECASMDSLNNNQRIYDEENYIQYISMLRTQIFSAKGVYGELEHPETYGVNFNNVSHKLLDVWYDKEIKKAYIKVMLLNTPKGKIAQEIVESGGQLAISARAAGEEVDGPNGQKLAKIKLLVTYDLVYHPGFSSATLDVINLNESINFGITPKNTRFGIMLYEDSIPTLNAMYNEFLNIPGNDSCFLEWVRNNRYDVKTGNLFESSNQQSQEEIEQQKLETNETNKEDKIQNQLANATEEDLSEYQNYMFQQTKSFEGSIKRRLKDQAKTVYDNSAGFVCIDEDENNN